MQVLGIPRSGFSLLMSSLDSIISWDWEQRAKLSEINQTLGRKVIKDFFYNKDVNSFKNNLNYFYVYRI